MINRFFGEVKFNYGWETKIVIPYNRESVCVTVSADAYYEKDEITKEQEDSFASFLRSKEMILHSIEEKIAAMKNGDYVPTLLKIQRDGETALIFDDKKDPEGGIAVVINSALDVFSVDQYL